ncbi:hypothetical protein HT031_000722 [Scenedesmus sp. PABB004]|nr:hypothetical protein HT031_000722 [Scenedesmus sp. PABB004]
MGNASSRSDRVYGDYEKCFERVESSVAAVKARAAARARRREALGRWASVGVSLALALAAAVIYQVQQQPPGTFTYQQHFARVGGALALPAAAGALHWLAALALGVLQRRDAARVKRLEGMKRSMVKELKDMSRYDRIKTLIDKYDPDARPPPPPLPAAAANGGPGPAMPALLMKGSGQVAGAAALAVAGAGKALVPLFDKLATSLISDNPMLLEDLRRAQVQLQDAEARAMGALHESCGVRLENLHLRQRLLELEGELGLPPSFDAEALAEALAAQQAAAAQLPWFAQQCAAPGAAPAPQPQLALPQPGDGATGSDGASSDGGGGAMGEGLGEGGGEQLALGGGKPVATSISSSVVRAAGRGARVVAAAAAPPPSPRAAGRGARVVAAAAAPPPSPRAAGRGARVVVAAAAPAPGPGGSVRVPRAPEAQVSQAAAAVEAAWRAGIKRQRVELLLPLIGATDLDDWPGGIRQQFKAAAPLVEGLLKQLKQIDELRGPLDVQIWDQGDAVGAWFGDKLAAVLFPTADVYEQLKALAERDPAPELLLIVNPQWELQGNLRNDFGWGSRKDAALALVESFTPTYWLRQSRVAGDDLRVLRAHPGQWQVHLVARDGSDRLLQSFAEQPTYAQLTETLKALPEAAINKSLIDRLRDEAKWLQDSTTQQPKQ